MKETDNKVDKKIHLDLFFLMTLKKKIQIYLESSILFPTFLSQLSPKVTKMSDQMSAGTLLDHSQEQIIIHQNNYNNS